MAHFADRVIFLPPPSSYGPDLEGLVLLPTAEGDTVAAQLSRAEGATKAVLFTHGNAEDIGHMQDFTAAYTKLSVTVLALDYPGYGMGSGKPSEPSAYAAGEAALSYLGEQGFPPNQIVLHGRSLGGGVAVELAARHPVAAMILESTFTSAFQVMLPFGGLPGDRFTSLAKLPSVRCPVMLIHGTRDEVVPFRHGVRLFEALPRERARAWWVKGAGHNDLLGVAGPRYWQQIASFLADLPESDR